MLAVMSKYFPLASGALARDYCSAPDLLEEVGADSASLIPSDLADQLDRTGRVPSAGDVKFIYVTRPGPGPINQPLSESLLDPSTGLPVPPGPAHARRQFGSSSA